MASAAFVFCGMMAAADEYPELEQAQPQGEAAEQVRAPSAVDYLGFLELSNEIAPYRESRLIDMATFNEMAADENTIILDTRSTSNYELGHIEGAIHLNFSDFADEKLAKIIPSKDTRILIYCNNNFSDNTAILMLKRVELALNIPTFINLYGYGYENIYELSETVSINDPDVNWHSDFDLSPLPADL